LSRTCNLIKIDGADETGQAHDRPHGKALREVAKVDLEGLAQDGTDAKLIAGGRVKS